MDLSSRVDAMISKPFALGGRGPQAYDCIGVMLELLSDYSLPDPALDESYTAGALSVMARRFIALPTLAGLKSLDILHLSGLRQHVAVVENESWCVHTTETQVVRSRLADLCRSGVVAYRLKDLAP